VSILHTCPECHGRRELPPVDGAYPRLCPKCKGAGKVPADVVLESQGQASLLDLLGEDAP
jgi:DnaJ-class molecular chaperone